jgi:hypothetical protein
MEMLQVNSLCCYLKQTKISFLFYYYFFSKQRSGGQNRSCLGLVPVGGVKVYGKGEGEWIWCRYSVHMYVNGKMVTVETISGMGRQGEKGEWGRGWMQLWYNVSTFVNVTMYFWYNNNNK